VNVFKLPPPPKAFPLNLLKGIRKTLVHLAENNLEVVLPAYTHLQRAQPIRLAHYFLAFREAFLKDTERFLDSYRRVDELPLAAELLGFNKLVRNSIYATADRDFIAECLFACALTGMHLSRLAEDLIIWSSEEFGYPPKSLVT